MNYGKHLKEIRTYELITQKAMAEILGLKRSTYKEYELQNSIMPINYILKICEYFKISLDYFFCFNQERNYTNSRAINFDLFMKRLIELRVENNLTQIELASILGCDNSTISKYENGKQIISTPFLYTICKKYKISADYLLGRVDAPKYLN